VEGRKRQTVVVTKGRRDPATCEEARLVFHNRLAVSLTGTIPTKATDCSNPLFHITALILNKIFYTKNPPAI